MKEMKKTAFTVFAMCLITVSFAQTQSVAATSAANGSPAASFQWANTTYDFGKVKAGVPVTYEFRFSNTGLQPLIISSVKASCGCTVTAYTKDPVEKDAAGFVSARYDAAKPGKFSKTVAVYANTVEGIVQLTIKGEVTE
jgi:hypothetical protein